MELTSDGRMDVGEKEDVMVWTKYLIRDRVDSGIVAEMEILRGRNLSWGDAFVF